MNQDRRPGVHGKNIKYDRKNILHINKPPMSMAKSHKKQQETDCRRFSDNETAAGQNRQFS